MINESVNIFVLNWNQKAMTIDCIKSLEKVTYNNLKIFNSPDNRSDKKHILKKLKNESLKDYEKVKDFMFRAFIDYNMIEESMNDKFKIVFINNC